MAIVTCHTPECGNAETPIDLPWVALGDAVTCGACSVPITDITGGVTE